MKKFVITTLSALLASHVFAFPGTATVPFVNQAVPVDGLRVSYNTNNGTQKVTCIAHNFYKGWLFITTGGIEKDTNTAFGNYTDSVFTFTNAGSSDANQFLVDKKGVIAFKDSNFKPHHPSVSCSYVPE